jgi:hypothetical protein
VRKNPVCNKKKKKIQDSAPARKSVLVMKKLRDLQYELLEYPPYSPDLAHSDFFLFPKLRLFLGVQRFSFFFDYTCRVVFCRSYVKPLQGRVNGAGVSLE